MIDVEFEWFNMKPDIDFHGIKNLTRQLLDVDSQLFEMSALADLVLSQPTIGSTVKVDGEDTDPYAFLTVLNLYEHREKEVIKDLVAYLIEKSKANSALSRVSELLKQSSPSVQIGLILTERLINVPSEISPPMYSCLLDEIESAVADNEPYNFSHYLIISKTYTEVESMLDQEDAPKQKKNKGGKSSQVYYFHPEDEVIEKHSLAYGDYQYTKDEGDAKADSKRAFQELGIKPQGHMILLEGNKFEGALRAAGDALGSPLTYVRSD